MAKAKTTKTGERKPAHEILVDLLNANGLGFFVRKQEVRFIEDNGILIDPPKVIVYYKDEVKKNNVNKIDLPKKE